MKGITLVLCCFGFISCGDYSIGPPIAVQNQSSLKIACRYSGDFPDTAVKMAGFTECKEILPYSTCKMESFVIGRSWKDLFEENPAGKLIFFIFDRDTVDRYGEDVVFYQEDRVLKKYILTFDSLEKMNYTITYP